MGLHKVRIDIKARFTRAASPDNNDILVFRVLCRGVSDVQSVPFGFYQKDIVSKNRVGKGLPVLRRSP